MLGCWAGLKKVSVDLPGSEVPVGRDLPGQSELVTPARVVSVLFVILGERLAPRPHNLIQGLGVLGSAQYFACI